MARLKGVNLKTARAYHLKLNFQAMYRQSPELAETCLKKGYFWATHHRLQPMLKAARTIKRHGARMLRWFKSDITNGVLEGINSLIQAAKAKGGTVPPKISLPWSISSPVSLISGLPAQNSAAALL